MNVILVISVLSVLCTNVVLAESASESRIVGGGLATEFQFPWQALIFANRPQEPIRYFGGSLISQNFVLTVAHFVLGADDTEIRFGSIDFNTPLISMKSRTFFVHPNFDPVTFAFNIAIIQLPQNVPNSNNHRPIRLLARSQQNDQFINGNAQISGFGVLSDGIRNN